MPRGVRVWQRALAPESEGRIEVPLRFRVVPGVWPDIAFRAAEGTSSDVRAERYELRFRCDPGARGWLLVDVGGFRVSLVGRTVTAAGHEVVVPGRGPIALALLLDGDHGSLEIDELASVPLAAEHLAAEVLAAPVTTNIAEFRIAGGRAAVGAIEVGPGVEVDEAVLYGLREPVSPLYANARAAQPDAGPAFYESDRFSVFDGRVVDAADDEPALVIDRMTIVSPLRVVEEFAWRDTGHGDMTRVVDRAELWRSAVETGRFPDLTTGFRSVDAAFALALETFQRNGSAEFALPGQRGMWSAGYFQGPGEGFGVWRRDTAHVALRSGSLLDPATARASLAYVVNSGFDNGSDGDALPAVAIWDHFLATGDESLIHETWGRLAETAAALDARFDDARGLVAAAQATSNDAFDEPEAGGFALSTEIYAMQTYEALSQMAALPAIADPRAGRWATRAAAMRGAIVEQYWNPRHGFFTSGPTGSEAWERGYWETSGAEAALWGFLGADAEPRTAEVLRRLREVAMSEFGVVLFPYKDRGNHFTGSVWYCWQAGIARAAARAGDAELVHRLVAQQVRTVVRNKTFYEVTDAVSGESWRWPGQLWHAAGFASLILFGVLGIRYDLDGMTFTPAVAPAFAGTRLDGLRYRDAILDIEVRGHGTHSTITLDGEPVERIAPDTTGRHAVVVTVR